LARILVTHIEAILERLEEAEAELQAAATEVRGTLRVASFQSVLFALIPSVLTRLAERHPGLRLEITHEQAIPAFDGLLAHEFDLVLGEEYPGVALPPVAGASTQLLARDELYLVLPSHGPYAVDAPADERFRLADLAGVPWILDPPSTAPGAWARNACREAGFEPDVRYAGSDLLFEVLLGERGHAASVIPGLLLSVVPRPGARIQRIPGRPHRRLTTGVRAGAAGQPAIRALREALRQASAKPAGARGRARTGSARQLSAAGDAGVIRAHPGAAVEQLAGRVEVPGVGRGLGDDVQDDLAHVLQPPVLEVLRPAGRRRVQAEAGQRRVRSRDLPPVEVEDGLGGLVRRRPPAGVVVEGQRLARRDRAEPEPLVVDGEVPHQGQARPARWQHRPPEVLLGQAAEDPEHVAALRDQPIEERLALPVRCRLRHQLSPALGPAARSAEDHPGRDPSAR
jgi:DNA-binding transcriptional LysR family regulator